MKKYQFAITILTLSFLFINPIFGQTKPVYQLPETKQETSSKNDPFILGNENGLYRIINNGTMEHIWKDCGVSKIHRTSKAWYFITDNGILTSTDLVNFTYINNGLPFLTIKTYKDGEVSLEKKAPLLKDISSDPLNPEILVTATKDYVYLSQDSGATWKNIGSMSYRTGGVKAVSVCHLPVFDNDGNVTSTQLVVTMAHPLFGFSYYIVNEAKPTWHDVDSGFVKLQTLPYTDEIADILPVVCKSKNGTYYCDLYISQTFLPNIYVFDWQNKKAVQIFKGANPTDTIDSICQNNSNLVYVTCGNVCSYSLQNKITKTAENFNVWKQYLMINGAQAQTAYIPSSITHLSTPLCLSELWLLSPEKIRSPYADKTNGKNAVYASVYQLRNQEGIDKYKTLLKENNLNTIVFDMKDDHGLLRFTPQSELLKKKGAVTAYKVDVEHLVKEFKEQNIYMVARIVVFKDPVLAKYGNHQYAVTDSKTGDIWHGIKTKATTEIDENGKTVEVPETYYDEVWVDPYCQEVWEYNVEIAKELIARGFDEVQFDYIRFPTDGYNLSDATFNWKDPHMDREAALISFLKYARENIDAPIGIDIYGANGWYRAGARTGQDVELISQYVDVICPMFYPSHFEQNLMDIAPREERPYRIFYYGSYRNTVIARNKVIIRPWVQAFYLNCAYDRQFYNKDYIKREIYGIKDSINHGYMYWNNGGRYEDISPESDEISPWKINEADLSNRIPVFSSHNGGK